MPKKASATDGSTKKEKSGVSASSSDSRARESQENTPKTTESIINEQILASFAAMK
mgnify:CR=1 FL=1|jgi:hypothetical protein